jgi:hypothetical protein
VKSRLLPCDRSDRVQRADGLWGTRNTYTVPCVAGDFTYERDWEPTDAESYNQWYQQSLPHHGRAASESVIGQEYHFLFAALLNNSITWHSHKR